MRLKKHLGQHFLKDKNILRKIADSAQITPQDTVIEIGAGGGALTEELVKRSPKAVIAVEIDPEWAEFLREKFKGKVEVINADAAELNYSKLSNGEKIKVVGNLPYYISTRIVRNLLEHKEAIESATFMVQDEVADRLVSTRGKSYGYLPALLQNFFEIEKLFRVPPSAFTPPPKVWSAVFKMKPKEEAPPLSDASAFEEFLKRAFSNRRKKIKKNVNLEKLPKELSHLKEKRAEEIPPKELYRIFTVLREQN